jgi:hypothetical protein
MTDLDEAFKTAVNRARGAGPFGGSPVTISCGSTFGKNIFVTPRLFNLVVAEIMYQLR